VRGALILAVGKLKDPALEQACSEYYKRCQRSLPITTREVRDLAALQAALPDRALLCALDERGQQLSSLEFAGKLGRFIEAARPLVFAIGGADGLDDAVRARADLLLSLGKMTFAHRLVRLILAEQLYRAVSILEGSPYHREG
jgi:23S rRNA (pseudouridine1915-N3)-methyltransferase